MVILQRETVQSFARRVRLSNERQILNYATPSRTLRVTDRFRLICAAVCVFTGLVGLGIIWVSAFSWLDVLYDRSIQTAHHIFEVSVISLLGLVIAGFSFRWRAIAMRPKQKATTIHGGSAGEEVL